MADRGSTDRIAGTLSSARDEARAQGSATVEAEHILLALATNPAAAAGRLLRTNDVDRAKLTAALREENRRALASVGVQPLTEDQQRASPPDRTPRFGASARDAVIRGQHVASAHRRRRADSTDLLVGILQAPIGTVPRALRLAGIDSQALIDQAEAGTSRDRPPR